jgi:hypothetical protein
MEIRRYVQKLSPRVLQQVIGADDAPLSEPVAEVDALQPVVETVNKMAAAGRVAASEDAGIARQLHSALKGLDQRTLTDQCLWQWMTTVPFRDYTESRWVPGLRTQPDLLHKPSVQKRYLGGHSLNGMSRNAVARLFWCAKVLWTPDDGYRYSDIVLGNQDFYQGLFERTLGLHGPLVAAAAAVLEHSDEDERRETLKNLNHIMTTVTVEVLNPDELGRLVESCRP